MFLDTPVSENPIDSTQRAVTYEEFEEYQKKSESFGNRSYVLNSNGMGEFVLETTKTFGIKSNKWSVCLKISRCPSYEERPDDFFPDNVCATQEEPWFEPINCPSARFRWNETSLRGLGVTQSGCSVNVTKLPMHSIHELIVIQVTDESKEKTEWKPVALGDIISFQGRRWDVVLRKNLCVDHPAIRSDKFCPNATCPESFSCCSYCIRDIRATYCVKPDRPQCTPSCGCASCEWVEAEPTLYRPSCNLPELDPPTRQVRPFTINIPGTVGVLLILIAISLLLFKKYLLGCACCNSAEVLGNSTEEEP